MRKDGIERSEKSEEVELLRLSSKGPVGEDGEAGGRPRRWPRSGGGGGGRGREEKDGNPQRKKATSRGDFHKSDGVSDVGWRGQSNKWETLCSPKWHSGQVLLVDAPILKR